MRVQTHLERSGRKTNNQARGRPRLRAFFLQDAFAEQAAQRPRSSSVMAWIVYLVRSAQAPKASTASGSANSVTVPHSSQMANTAAHWWFSEGWRQATKALSDSTRCAVPEAIRRSRER